MLTGCEELVAAQIRQERLREAEEYRLCRQLPRSGSGITRTVVTLLKRVRTSTAVPRPAGQAAAPGRKAQG